VREQRHLDAWESHGSLNHNIRIEPAPERKKVLTEKKGAKRNKDIRQEKRPKEYWVVGVQKTVNRGENGEGRLKGGGKKKGDKREKKGIGTRKKRERPHDPRRHSCGGGKFTKQKYGGGGMGYNSYREAF